MKTEQKNLIETKVSGREAAWGLSKYTIIIALAYFLVCFFNYCNPTNELNLLSGSWNYENELGIGDRC